MNHKLIDIQAMDVRIGDVLGEGQEVSGTDKGGPAQWVTIYAYGGSPFLSKPGDVVFDGPMETVIKVIRETHCNQDEL